MEPLLIAQEEQAKALLPWSQGSMQQAPQRSHRPDRGQATTCQPGSDAPSTGATPGPVPPAAGAGSR